MFKYKVLEPCFKEGKLWATGEYFFSQSPDHKKSHALEFVEEIDEAAAAAAIEAKAEKKKPKPEKPDSK